MSKTLPGERAKHWADAIMTIWPIILFLVGGTVYGNSETVRGWLHGTTPEEPDGKTEVLENGMTFEQSVVKFSNEVRVEIKQLKQDIQQLQAKSRRKDGGLQDQITKWHGND